jgi:drug/metabolite transporter (DMT)-like permease
MRKFTSTILAPLGQTARVPAQPRVVGLALVVTAALLFVVNAGVSRVVLRSGVSPAELTLSRITGTAGVLLLVALVFRRRALRPPRGRLAALLVVHGVVGVALLQWVYFVAIDRLPVGLALLLEYLAPLLVVLWARFVQGEVVRRSAWVGLGMALLGLAMATGIVKGGLAFDTVGVLAGLAAAVCFATYFLVGEHGVALLDPLQVALWSFGIAAVAMNVVSPMTAFPWGLLGDSTTLLGRLDALSAPVGVLVLWVTVLGTLAPFALALVAMRTLSASTTTQVAMLEPVGVTVLGFLWFRETLDAVALVGCALVVLGILAAQAGRAAPASGEPPHLAAP